MDTTFDFRPAARRPAPMSTATPPLHRLARHAVLPLRLARGTCVAVSAGRLWLTDPGDPGDPGDHFIGAGEHHVVGGGLVVLEGDSAQPAEFQLTTSKRLRR